MTYSFNISFRIEYRKDLKAGISDEQRNKARIAAEAKLAQWLTDNPIPPSLLKVQTQNMSSADITKNTELLEAIVHRIKQIAPNLPGKLKDATMDDPGDQAMADSDCYWVPTLPDPPPPAGYWQCGNQPLSLNTVVDFHEVPSGDWEIAPAGRGHIRFTVNLAVASVPSKSPKTQK